MSAASSHMSVLSSNAAVATLAELIRSYLGDSRAASGIGRLEVPLDFFPASRWLAAQRPGNRVLWIDRDHTRSTAAVGSADFVAVSPSGDLRSAIAGVSRQLERAPDTVRYYGGARFDLDRTQAPEWASLGGARFALPRFELICTNSTSQLAVNLRLPEDIPRRDAIIEELRSLSFPAQTSVPPLPPVLTRTDRPDRDTWMTRVGKAVDTIRDGHLSKIVLARETLLELDRPVDPIALATRIESAERCFVFVFESDDGNAFLGASPERLYRREGAVIRSEALAGTRRRGATPEEDIVLGEKLLTSAKEAREHSYVADTIRRVLAAHCRRLSADPQPSLRKLERVQHLATRFEGDLLPSAGDSDILADLHPTPAVGGVPTPDAIAAIRDLETFDRGWYAGPVGWIGRNSAEFAVGLRSALLHGSTLRLYSGAGIVDGSHPDKEWDEIENKIAGFLKLLAVS